MADFGQLRTGLGRKSPNSANFGPVSSFGQIWPDSAQVVRNSTKFRGCQRFDDRPEGDPWLTSVSAPGDSTGVGEYDRRGTIVAGVCQALAPLGMLGQSPECVALPSYTWREIAEFMLASGVSLGVGAETGLSVQQVWVLKPPQSPHPDVLHALPAEGAEEG